MEKLGMFFSTRRQQFIDSRLQMIPRLSAYVFSILSSFISAVFIFLDNFYHVGFGLFDSTGLVFLPCSFWPTLWEKKQWNSLRKPEVSIDITVSWLKTSRASGLFSSFNQEKRHSPNLMRLTKNTSPCQLFCTPWMFLFLRPCHEFAETFRLCCLDGLLLSDFIWE